MAYTDYFGTYYFLNVGMSSYKIAFAYEFNSASGSAWSVEYWNDKPTLEQGDQVFLSPFTAVVANAALAPPPVSIQGHVTDTSGDPLVGVRVEAYRSDGAGGWGLAGAVQSIDDGAGGAVYSFAGLTDGQYKVGFARSWSTEFGDAYTTQFWNGKATLADADPVTVSAGTVATADAVLSPPGVSIQGRVTDADGSPLNDVSISVYQESSPGSFGQVASSYTANDPLAEGRYAFYGLPDGDYVVEFSRAWDTPLGSTYLTEYWNGKSSIQTADPIIVNGSVVTADMALRAPEPSVSGRAGAG